MFVVCIVQFGYIHLLQVAAGLQWSLWPIFAGWSPGSTLTQDRRSLEKTLKILNKCIMFHPPKKGKTIITLEEKTQGFLTISGF